MSRFERCNLGLTCSDGCDSPPWLEHARLQGSDLVGSRKHNGLLRDHDVDSMERSMAQLAVLAAAPGEEGPIRRQSHGVVSTSSAGHDAMAPVG